ncbi:MAG: serine/threonine-protein kinase [Gammaproteobacteria bacterium]
MPSILSKRPFWVSLAGLILLLGSYTAAFQRPTAGFYDVAYSMMPSYSPEAKVAAINIDQASIDANGQWPWSGDLLADMLIRLRKAGAKAVGLMLPMNRSYTPSAMDDVMSEVNSGQAAIDSKRSELMRARSSATGRARDNINRRLEALNMGADKLKTVVYWLNRLDNGRILARAIRNSGNVVLAGTYQPSQYVFALPKGLDQLAIKEAGGNTPWYFSKWLHPLVEGPESSTHALITPPNLDLAEYAAGVGLLPSLSAAYSMQEMPLALDIDNTTFPSFLLQLASTASGFKKQDVGTYAGLGVQMGAREILTLPGYRYFVPPPRFRDGQPPIPIYSANLLLNDKLPDGALKGRTVVVGLSAPSLAPQPSSGELGPVASMTYSLASLLDGEQVTVPGWFYLGQRLLLVLVMLYLMILPAGMFTKSSGHVLSGVLVLVLLNGGLILLLTRQYWLPVTLPALFLLAGHLVLATRYYLDEYFRVGKMEAAEARRQLGLNLQAQGLLDQAFQEFRRCPVTPSVVQSLYQLGLDFERKRQFRKAQDAYELIAQNEPEYRDVRERLARLSTFTGSSSMIRPASGHTGDTLVLDDPALEKPKLGRYEIQSQIGRGAMGIVYLGLDPKIGRKVAIKTLALNQEFDDGALEEVKSRFYREAEAAGRLAHPNIVTVYDVGEEHDLAYIAMDYAQGVSLDNYTRVGELLQVDDVLRIGIQAAEALDYAHKQGVVHRDIKPANLIYDADKRQVKITDFGIARLTDSSKTRTGTLLGTPAYMSPEQISGRDIDGRADLFSLGVSIYHMLAGALPFEADSMANLVYKITQERHPPINKVRAILSTEIAKFVDKALSKEVDKRFQSGAAMALALRKVRAAWREAAGEPPED